MLRRLGVTMRTRGRVRLGAGVRLGRGVRFDVAEGGSVVLGEGVIVGERVRFHVGPGARVVVGPGARLGERSALTAHERIDVGPRCILGAEVVLLDFDHVADDAEAPVRLQGLVTAPVVLAEGALLDTAAVVLSGVTVGAGAHVGVRSVVRKDVPPGADVAGVPARPVRTPEPRVVATRRLARRPG